MDIFENYMSRSLMIIMTNFLLLRHQISAATLTSTNTSSISLTRNSFPPNFIFGAASSAFQYEGAAKEDGKGPSIWDTFTHQFPDKISDRSNGDVADDFYHRYKEDVQLMRYIGLKGFRFSISWPRVLPYGKRSKGVNREGIAFYNNLINDLLLNGIQPFVTLFHWDLPQALEDEYGGFLSPLIVEDFRDFAELCFEEFGDRVKHWSTINEPWPFVIGGYDSSTFTGTFAPGRCSAWLNKGCPAGDSATEPYLVGHNLLLSHAAVVQLYRQKYKVFQKGDISIVLVTFWMVPLSNTKADILAAQRAQDFYYGWFLDPIIFGDYPQVMRNSVGKRLPKFTPEQSRMLKGSIDFLGINYYSALYASPLPVSDPIFKTFSTDLQVLLTGERNGRPIGTPTGKSTFYSYPAGLRELLLYTKEKYNNPIMYVTENGYGDSIFTNIEKRINDQQRIRFFQQHLSAARAAIEDGVNLKGYFAWTLLDSFEWASGYTLKFGLYYVDFQNGLKRFPKLSALWMKRFLQ